MNDYHIQSLAFLGDAYFTLKVREQIMRQKPGLTPRGLHVCTVPVLCAGGQSKLFLELYDLFTDDEKAVARRARNGRGLKPPAAATPEEYRNATALEAVLGYLYVEGKTERLERLFCHILPIV
ncbi:MAG: ribonuclease III [Firmicutes bacterium]|nr:ribonuclease III [Bacillota bacterium]